MRKLWPTILWSTFLVVIVVTLGFVAQAHHDLECTKVEVRIDQAEENYFVEKEDILDLLPFDLTVTPSIPAIDIQVDNIEKQLNNHPAIKNAEVYLSLEGQLSVYVKQRKPIARIFTDQNESYYIDNEGFMMPLSSKFTSRVMVISGNIRSPYSKWYGHNLKTLAGNDSLSKKTMLDDLFILCDYITHNPFWKAQIEHIYVNKDLEVELIPRVGSHTIVLGEIVDIDKKFTKLKIFYEQGLSKTGWNEYSVINLKFEDQIVCTKRYNY